MLCINVFLLTIEMEIHIAEAAKQAYMYLVYIPIFAQGGI